MMKENTKKLQKKRERRPKLDAAKFFYPISFNKEEYVHFLALSERSGLQVKAHFIISCIFNKTTKTIKIDKGTIDL